MWILVVGGSQVVERHDGGVAQLRQLGCRVRVADLFEPLETDDQIASDPPAAVLIEALDQVEAARAAFHRLRAAAPLSEVPVLVAVTVSALQKVKPTDAFDDLVLVPYVPVELYVRIRRAEWKRSEFAMAESVKIGDLLIDLAGYEVRVDGRRIELTQQEFALLRFLSENRGRVFTRSQLLERVWGVDYYGGSRTVDIHVRRLRMKLGEGAVPIETVRGVGYKMRVP